jgi:hypothetical protein
MSMIGNLPLLSDEELSSLLAEPAGVEAFLFEGLPPAEDELYLDKAWHGIHFLLTGTAWEGEPPLNFIVAGGIDIGTEDVGYARPLGFTSADVREIAAALAPLSADELRSRFDPKRMLELGIYPEIWDRPPEEDDTLAHLLGYFDQLKGFLQRAAENGRALIVYVS